MSARPNPPRKHVPIRTCVVCRQQAGKRTLTRVVRTEQGVEIDLSGKRNGRGAYLCDNPTCWERAAASEVLAKALRTTLTPETRAQLRQSGPSS
ncbi:MAG: YlxR family protein [Chloroflexi bacterium]|nr:YlxR family protein [Chloroflexota bacterium]